MGLMHANGAAGFLLHVSDTFASQDSTATRLYRTTEHHTPDKQNFAVHSLRTYFPALSSNSYHNAIIKRGTA